MNLEGPKRQGLVAISERMWRSTIEYKRSLLAYEANVDKPIENGTTAIILAANSGLACSF